MTIKVSIHTRARRVTVQVWEPYETAYVSIHTRARRVTV